jgi:hypothetical protein
MAIRYDALPRSSLDLQEHTSDFKDKPRRRTNRISLLVRKARRLCRPIYASIFVLILLVCQLLFNASYNDPHPAFIHPHETVFIAANIINADLINGAWGDSLLSLIDLIGQDRVFVSIYGGPTDALKALGARIPCKKSIVSEELDPISLDSIQHTKLPTGESRIKRIAYLAEVRNKALMPLNTRPEKFDRVLFINDVFFEPMDAARLLWSTNQNAEGTAQYKAACAADFITSWKYYDTYGTRDLEGYSIGVPIYPWFANEADAVSRNDVLAGRDTVRVKSCWGGMVAFDARYLQRDLSHLSSDAFFGAATLHPEHQNRNVTPTVPIEPKTPGSLPSTNPVQLPLYFRSEPEPFWDSSECCLIHSDIISIPLVPGLMQAAKQDRWGVGIFMNPHVRVAYDERTFKNIWLAKRFERLFSLPQRILNHFAKMPRYNYRRTEVEGEVIHDRIWISEKQSGSVKSREVGEIEDVAMLKKRATLGSAKGKAYWDGQGHYEPLDRIASRGGYCGVRQLLLLKEAKLEDGEGNWDNLLDQVPPLDI